MEALEASRRLYELLVATSMESPPRLRTWTGDEWGPADAAATLVLQHPGAFGALLLPPPDLTAGEAYVYDDIDIEGDIVSALRFAHGLLSAGPVTRVRALRLARSLPRERRRQAAERPQFEGRIHSIRRDRQVVSHHYDTGNDFFALFLDPQMVYSCAHFLDPAEPLEVAQRRKLDLICRKLELRPGDRFLDVGCGWGALVIHAAVNYGVEATGITVSTEQAEEARKRATRAGVADRVQILEADYRELGGQYDAIASVGMAEHVGLAKLPTYFRHLKSLLAPGGQLLNHAIYTRSSHLRRRPSFVRTYVFPDGKLHRVDEAISIASDSGFELRDVEMLRQSYALTLRRWVSNLEANASAARAIAGEKVYRIWRLYMAGSAVAFEFGHITVGQLLLTDPRRPWQLGRSRLLAADDR